VLKFSKFQTLIGGIALIGVGFGALWIWLEKHQARKEDPAHGGALPTCGSFLDAMSIDLTNVLGEYRIFQAQHPADSANNPATLRQGSPAEPGAPYIQPRSGSTPRADQAVPHVPQTKSGSSDPNVQPSPGPEPTPQRTNSDGRVYSKAPAYVDSYNETKK